MINLAGKEDCDQYILEELKEAQIEAVQVPRAKREVPSAFEGHLGPWKFTRAWYYWVAEAPYGKGKHGEIARNFNIKWRQEVRVAGFAGGADTENFLSGAGTVDEYHIDSQRGLNAFVKELLLDMNREKGVAQFEEIKKALADILSVARELVEPHFPTNYPELVSKLSAALEIYDKKK